MTDRSMNADEVFLYWKSLAKIVGKVRYTSTERQEQLDVLCELFKKHDTDFDEAKSYKKKIIEFMVTKEGMKGNGKHKGWKEATEEDFIGILTGWYSGDFTVVNDTTEIKRNMDKKNDEDYGTLDYTFRTPLIVAWTKHKFKHRWTESICLEAHKVGGPLWQLFDKEVMNSKWAKSGERPEWAKNAF